MTDKSTLFTAKIESPNYNILETDLEPAEEVTDDESIENFKPFENSVPLQCSTNSYDSNSTVTPFNGSRSNFLMDNNEDYSSKKVHGNNVHVPIVGYEVMEERARFTVYKLRVEHSENGNSWIVYRRYTDFVRLSNAIKTIRPDITAFLPRKRFFGNNFDPEFLNTRVCGLQQFINAILAVDELVNDSHVQEFLCLNESSLDTEKFLEDSRAMFDALSETIYHLRNQLKEKDFKIVELNERLCSKELLLSSCAEFFKNSTMECNNCSTEFKKSSNLSNLVETSPSNSSDMNENICDSYRL